MRNSNSVVRLGWAVLTVMALLLMANFNVWAQNHANDYFAASGQVMVTASLAAVIYCLVGIIKARRI